MDIHRKQLTFDYLDVETGSLAAGEDLLQAALERLVRNWSRVRGDKEG